MRVLFLTKYPEEGASSRYRVYQYLPYLEAAGIDYEVKPFMSSAMYRLLYQSGHTVAKLGHAVWASLRRLSLLAKAGKYDLIFMQRECLPLGPPVMERLFRRWGIPTIFDYDDALFIFKGSTHNRLADFFKRPQRFLEIFGLVDCVLAGNGWLRDRAAEYSADARIFLVAEDLVRYSCRPPHRNSETVTIGWLGSPSTEKYLHLITPALRDVCRRYPQVRLKVVGGGQYAAEGVPVEQVPWDFATEVAEMHTFDIGIMPLPLEEWSRGKSGGKARTYMAIGLPAVCTRIGFNCELIRDGETGFLVESVEEWTNVLALLVEKPELRQQVGNAARHEVEEHYSLDRMGAEFVTILQEVASRGRKA